MPEQDEARLMNDARQWMIAHGYYRLLDAERMLAACCRNNDDPAKDAVLRGVRLMIGKGMRVI